MNLLVEIVGWVGIGLILAAYYLVSVKKVEGDSGLYQWLNLVGAVGIVVNTLTHRAWPAMALNIVWGVIAVRTLMMGRKG